MLDPDALSALRSRKNLLAFSGGVDSTALFFLLKETEIRFDVALVNYHTRAESDAEAAYAQELAARHAKTCHLHDAPLLERNFEARARDLRYTFFESLIAAHGYETLITAHQLDDRLEWLLMQLCRGAGLPEMLGMRGIAEHPTHLRVRPLLRTPRARLQRWLDERGIRYFEDTSNADLRHERNFFRHTFAAELLEHGGDGILHSFDFLTCDADRLLRDMPDMLELGDAVCLRPTADRRVVIIALDRWFKARGILMRQGDRQRLLKEDEVAVSRRYAVSITARWAIATPLCDVVMPKAFKEQCRQMRIGPGVRPWLFTHPEMMAKIAAE